MKKRIVIYLVLLTNILLSQKIITPKDVKLFLLSIVENADTDIIQKYGKDADDLLRTGYTIKSNSINDDRVIEQNYRTYVIIYGEELRKDPFLKPKVDEVAVIQKQSPQKNIYLIFLLRYKMVFFLQILKDFTSFCSNILYISLERMKYYGRVE